ncbi:GerAB/ArcD/ProY family transporter [Paenibacillus sedimenti]|uniref:Endospore germination permease n=1 Tax=Paenibacillus sedimenti TaxID=2770274 RepID=A0A926KNE0_9BACL|nr:endospore germination permease [Paenibacillus sedimenti]MBD0381047.1 endospore germination permease [Paenibacillus sedimenti]
MKVTGLQVFWMIAVMDLGMTLIMTLTPSLQAAKQDIWISFLVAGGIALLITLLVTKVAPLYPGQDLIRFSQAIMGKWFGGMIVVIYFVQWYTIIPIVLRQFSDLVQIMLLQETPKLPVILIMVVLITYATYSGGIEGIARCSEVLGPIILLMVILVMVASIKDLDAKNLLPVFVDSGMMGIFMGAAGPASYLGHAVEYLMLASFLNQPQKGAPYAYWAVATASFFTLVAGAMAVATVGVNLTPKMWYPFFEMSRKISLFGFLENFDAIAIVIWVASVFIKLSIYMFVTCYGTAEFLQVKNWKNMVWFVAPVVTVFALFPKNVSQATGSYLLNYWVPVALPVNMLGLPLLLLIVGKLKQKKSQSG